MIILDFGSGNTCRNDLDYAKKMIAELSKIDTERKCIIKWQLFQNVGNNIPLHRSLFGQVYQYAEDCGFKTTASVFDVVSLIFLLNFDVPFIKIANRKELYPLVDHIPIDIRTLKSVGLKVDFNGDCLACVSEYPAKMEDYEKRFGKKELSMGISDHTTDWTLYKKYQPEIYECHFKLPDSVGNDSGPFAKTPEQLREIL